MRRRFLIWLFCDLECAHQCVPREFDEALESAGLVGVNLPTVCCATPETWREDDVPDECPIREGVTPPGWTPADDDHHGEGGRP